MPGPLRSALADGFLLCFGPSSGDGLARQVDDCFEPGYSGGEWAQRIPRDLVRPARRSPDQANDTGPLGFKIGKQRGPNRSRNAAYQNALQAVSPIRTVA